MGSHEVAYLELKILLPHPAQELGGQVWSTAPKSGVLFFFFSSREAKVAFEDKSHFFENVTQGS